LKHINLNDCYEWLNWAAPAELSRKIIRFVDQYKNIVERLASIVDRMKALLFTLRLQEQTANRTRAMAQYLKQHPEWIPLDWSNENIVPNLLKRGSGLTLKTGINTHNSSLQADFVSLIQELKRQSKPILPIDRSAAALPIDGAVAAAIEHQQDLYEAHVESMFANVLGKQGHKISALTYCQKAKLDVKPELWLDIVFAQYCCLPQRLRRAIALEMAGDCLPGFNGNQQITEIWLRRAQ
ncbi:MAG: hypothetical protein Q8Q40_03440, partial [Methylococcaceae bacterium]|nr:hypothetical protein [Methylococcaceae bacterium]